MTESIHPIPGRDKANELVASHGRHVGVADATLDPSGDAAFGEFGFHHDSDKDALVARVFVAKAWPASSPPEDQEPYRKVGAALNDPQIGGMFEQGGGYFILDEEKRMYFLAKDLPLATTTAEGLRKEMDELLDLGATWTVRWFARVADITHGRAAPPQRPITREDDDGGT